MAKKLKNNPESEAYPQIAALYPLPQINQIQATDADQEAFAPLYKDWQNCANKTTLLYPTQSLINLCRFIAVRAQKPDYASDYFLGNYVRNCTTGGRSRQAFKFVEQHLHSWGLIDYSLPELQKEYNLLLAKNARNNG